MDRSDYYMLLTTNINQIVVDSDDDYELIRVSPNSINIYAILIKCSGFKYLTPEGLAIELNMSLNEASTFLMGELLRQRLTSTNRGVITLTINNKNTVFKTPLISEDMIKNKSECN